MVPPAYTSGMTPDEFETVNQVRRQLDRQLVALPPGTLAQFWNAVDLAHKTFPFDDYDCPKYLLYLNISLRVYNDQIVDDGWVDEIGVPFFYAKLYHPNVPKSYYPNFMSPASYIIDGTERLMPVDYCPRCWTRAANLEGSEAECEVCGTNIILL